MTLEDKVELSKIFRRASEFAEEEADAYLYAGKLETARAVLVFARVLTRICRDVSECNANGETKEDGQDLTL